MKSDKLSPALLKLVNKKTDALSNIGFLLIQFSLPYFTSSKFTS
ncbi:hypothetical protein QE390_003409 [Siphonobacter sp. SORGH_AS 1065]|nr:hypothetical protein [Siphonobacter sp. SORGH_AS_1065]